MTREEWGRVYRETLDLVKAFPLAELRQVPVRGIETRCLVRTEERKSEEGTWRGKDVAQWGWCADGDYKFCRVAEDYYLPRDLVSDDRYEADAPDALYQMIPIIMDGYEWDDPRFDHHYTLWGSKTQGEPYHMCLLSVGCLIAARLGQKACLYGNITRGQCQKAVRMANERLAEPIDLPDRCDLDRLFARIDRLPLTGTEKLQLFCGAYLGRHDGAFGTFLRDRFPVEACDAYWDMSFEADRFETVGFLDDLKRYLLWGFDLDKLCSFVRFENGEAEDPYRRFVTLVMDSKLHLPEKDCTDVLEIDADEEEPYGVETLFAQLALLGAKNQKVDRYVPIDQIRSALRAGIGERCPVDEIIDAYLEQEAATEVVRLTGVESSEEIDRAAAIDASQALNDVVNARMRAQNELCEAYDIAHSVLLPFYEAGDSINPKVEENVCDYLDFYRGVTSEDTYRTLMGEGPRERCAWLAYQNRYITLRDKDWEKIFDDIMAHPESFARYYPMARVVANTRAVEATVRAFVTNDELWAHMVELTERQHA